MKTRISTTGCITLLILCLMLPGVSQGANFTNFSWSVSQHVCGFSATYTFSYTIQTANPPHIFYAYPTNGGYAGWNASGCNATNTTVTINGVNAALKNVWGSVTLMLTLNNSELATAGANVVVTSTGIKNGSSCGEYWWDFLCTADIYGIAIDQAPNPEALVLVSMPAKPGPPTKLSATPMNEGCSIAFTPPTNTGGTSGCVLSIHNYDYTLDDGGTWTSFNPPQNASPVTITGLTNGTTYSIKLRSYNGAYSSNASSAVSVTPAVEPSAPTNLTGTPGNNQAIISFTPGFNGGSAITNYKYKIDDGSWTACSPPVTTSPVTVTGLTNGTLYSIKIRAVNAVGDGAESGAVQVTPATVPTAPTDLLATRGDQQATIAFTAPSSDGGATITNYKYQLNEGTWTAFAPARTASPVTITGLTNGTLYAIKLRAVNAAGDGTESLAVTVTPATCPGKPTSISARPGNSQVTVSFTPPASNGGMPITNYAYSTDDGGTWNTCSPEIIVSPMVITGLTNGTEYPVRIRAINDVGPGQASNAVSTTPGVPLEPTGLTGNPGNTKATVTFTAPADNGTSPVTNYQYQLDGGGWVACSPPVTASPVLITGLTNDQQYVIELRAVNAAGAGLESDTVKVTPRSCTNPTNPGSIAEDQVICNGDVPATISNATSPEGYFGILQYKWQSSTTGESSGFGDIENSDAESYAPGALTQSTWYRRVVRVTCLPDWSGAVATDPVKITVHPVPIVDDVTDKFFCNAATTTTIAFSGTNATSFDWTNSNTAIGLDGSGTGDIGPFSAANTGTSPIDATIKVTPVHTALGKTCNGSPKTFTITINPSADIDQPGDLVLCNGGASGLIAFTTGRTGGTTTYSWTNNETSIGLPANGNGDIASFTALNTTTAPLVATVEVTPHFENGGTTCDGTPKHFTITVNPSALVAQPDNQLLCQGSATDNITFTTDRTGGTTTYSWTNNEPGIGLPANGNGDIASFTALNTTTAPLVATVEVTPHFENQNVTCDGPVKTFTITVDPTTAGGIVSGGGIVCYGSHSTLLTLSGYVGSVQHWQYSTDQANWTEIPSSISDTYTAVDLVEDTWYRAYVKSGVCQGEFSSTDKITVFKDYHISGYVRYYNNPKTPLNGIKIVLKEGETPVGSPVYTTATGFYQFTGLTNGNYSFEISSASQTGEWQTWGGVNNTDYLLISRHIGGKSLPENPPVIRYAADVKTPHPTIDNNDATAVRQASRFGWGGDHPYFDIEKWVFSGPTTTEPITGISLNCADIVRNIYGSCAGDVNGSFVPLSGNKQVPIGVRLENQGSIGLSGELVFPVWADKEMEIGAITLYLDFDSSILEITGIEMGGQNSVEPTWIADGNLLYIGWVSLDPVMVPAGGTVFNIHARMLNFDQRSLNVVKNIRFELDENPLSELADGEGNVIEGARLVVPDAAPKNTFMTGVISVYPNPARDIVNVEYQTEAAASFHAELMTLQGRIVATIPSAGCPAGKNKFTLNLADIAGGIYILRATSGETTENIKIVVNK